jgi:hypothetical protein
MKTKISRQHIYLLATSLFLFIFVIVFSFTVLIPKGQEYRVQRLDLRKTSKEFREFKEFHDEMQDKLQTMQQKNRHIITAFKATFNPTRFEKQNKEYFLAFNISAVNRIKSETIFAVYEVNTTSKISSPKGFYNFLDSINKSDWIIGVNFPIDFKREGDLIKSSFTMKVYCNNNESNSTASGSVAK